MAPSVEDDFKITMAEVILLQAPYFSIVSILPGPGVRNSLLEMPGEMQTCLLRSNQLVLLFKSAAMTRKLPIKSPLQLQLSTSFQEEVMFVCSSGHVVSHLRIDLQL